MFSKACEIAAGYTIPIVILKREYSTKCSSSIGAGVIVNGDGWLLTANHIVEAMTDIDAKSAATLALLQQKHDIEADHSLTDKERRRQLNRINIAPNAPIAYSIWYGLPYQVKISQWRGIQAVDLALGKIENFQPRLRA